MPLDSEGNPSRDALPELIDEAADGGPQFLYLGPDSFIGEHAKYITGLANDEAAPLLCLDRADACLVGCPVRTGGALPEGRALHGPRRRSKYFAARKPCRTFPVEVMPEFSYQIRADVAQSLNILPNLSLLDYAEIIGQ